MIDYSYLPDGRLDTVQQGSTTLAAYGYDSLGRLQSVARANGATTSYSYDNADRLTDLQTTTSGSTLSRFQYTVDRLGLRTQVAENVDTTNRTSTYGYDGLNRLTSAQESGGTDGSASRLTTYSYDQAGNRTDGGRTYDAANQVVGWSYDAAGNLLSDGTTSYSYDALNRAVTTGSTTNSYNADGVLVQQGTTRYVQDLAAPLSQILGDGTSTYVYGQERLFAQQGSTRIWYATDALGSVRQTLNDVGVAQGSVLYDPWGQVESGTVPTFGFTGELQQGANVYLRARWYNSQRGVFSSRDSFAGWPEQPYSLMPYQYAYSNPVRLTDPSGRNPFPDPIGKVSRLEGIYIGAVIAMAYMAGNLGNRWAEYPVPGASTGKKAGNPRVNGFADLVDFAAGEVYEVKSERTYRRYRSTALKQLNGYVDGLNIAAAQPSSSPLYRPPPATGTWIAGNTFLATSIQSFGLWPFGIDASYNPSADGYYEIKATLSQDRGIIIYWGEKITDARARLLVPRYAPDQVTDFIDNVYQPWRKPQWGNRQPQLYPSMSVTNPSYWCKVLGDMVRYYYEELGRIGNQLGPADPGMGSGVPGPGLLPIPVP